MMHDPVPFASTAWRVSAGALAWAAHFTVIYGYTGLVCARGGDGGSPWVAAVPWVVGITTVVAAALVLRHLVPLLRGSRPEAFAEWLGAGIAGLALVGIVFEGITVLWVPPCA